MKSTGSLLVSILIGIVVLFLAFKLLGFALKLLGVLIVAALAVGAYFVVRGRIGKGGDGA
jgi:hypothetical protein